MRVNIIIPCYNEKDNLLRIRDTFLMELKQSDEIDVRLVLVENGSADGSRSVMFDADFVHEAIEIALVDVNQGYGHGIKQGLRHSDADFYCWAHADLQTPLGDVLEVVKSGCKNDKNVIAGKRTTTGGQKLQSFIFDTLTSLVMGCRSVDINGQPKFFHHKYKSYFVADLAPSDFSLDMYFFKVFNQLNKEVSRYPVSFLQRELGEAKGGQVSLYKRFILLIKMLAMAKRLRISTLLIIRHRCYDFAQASKENAVDGAEIDIRIHNGELVVEHDPFKEGPKLRLACRI